MYPLHVSVDFPEYTSDDSGAGFGGSAGSFANFLDGGCLDGADTDML